MLCKDIEATNMCTNIVVQRSVRKKFDNKCSDMAKVRDKCVL